jgi:hypothetical protein
MGKKADCPQSLHRKCRNRVMDCATVFRLIWFPPRFCLAGQPRRRLLREMWVSGKTMREGGVRSLEERR